jgi:hypothetical protein
MMMMMMTRPPQENVSDWSAAEAALPIGNALLDWFV